MIPDDYAAAEVLLLGSAHQLIRGAIKGLIFDDAPSQGRRESIIEELE